MNEQAALAIRKLFKNVRHAPFVDAKLVLIREQANQDFSSAKTADEWERAETILSLADECMKGREAEQKRFGQIKAAALAKRLHYFASRADDEQDYDLSAALLEALDLIEADYKIEVR